MPLELIKKKKKTTEDKGASERGLALTKPVQRGHNEGGHILGQSLSMLEA